MHPDRQRLVDQAPDRGQVQNRDRYPARNQTRNFSPPRGSPGVRHHQPSRSFSPPRHFNNAHTPSTYPPPPPPPQPKEKPNFKPTGLLAKEANTIAGTDVVLKYHEPVDACKPTKGDWRLFSFGKKKREESGEGGSERLDDNNEDVPPITLSARSAWLFGSERKAVAVQLSHDTIDGQHAVIQFRRRTKESDKGDLGSDGLPRKITQVKPYIVDLESGRGTRLNGEKIPTGRFIELRKGDIVQFGRDKREWVLVKTDEGVSKT